jgi:hypothetical protein
MTREGKAIVGGSITGALLALLLGLLFGVLDVQCENGLSWNAAQQICE